MADLSKDNLERPIYMHNRPRKDRRGFFMEAYSAKGLECFHGITTRFVQDNFSFSGPHVIRGMHYQTDQAKLVMVLEGRIRDIVVDIRPESPEFGSQYAYIIDSGKCLYVPAGFAHGFSVMSDRGASVYYKVSQQYDPKAEGGFNPKLGSIASQWMNGDAILSERDKAFQGWESFSTALKRGSVPAPTSAS